MQIPDKDSTKKNQDSNLTGYFYVDRKSIQWHCSQGSHTLWDKKDVFGILNLVKK